MDKARLFPYDEGRKDGMPMEIGAKLRQARIAAGLTQEQTAEALGVSRQSISNWENEKNYPDIVSVVRLSDLYAVSLDALLKEEAPRQIMWIIWRRAPTPCGAGGSNLC